MKSLFINRIKDNFHKSACIIVVQALIMSIVMYGISIWIAANIPQVESVKKKRIQPKWPSEQLQIMTMLLYP